MADPYRVVRDFEAAVCEYTGAPFCVTTNSCTMALLLAVAWHLEQTPAGNTLPRSVIQLRRSWGASYQERVDIEIPRRTYQSVPMSIIHAGGRPVFRDEEWQGWYRLKPLRVWDSARWFTSGMWHRLRVLDPTPEGGHPRDLMLCLSFHASKTLGISQGGAILHSDPDADAWLRRARFDGRAEGVAPKDDTGVILGHHCYLSADVAAALLLKLHSLPRHNAPLPNDDYPALDELAIFK